MYVHVIHNTYAYIYHRWSVCWSTLTSRRSPRCTQSRRRLLTGLTKERYAAKWDQIYVHVFACVWRYVYV